MAERDHLLTTRACADYLGVSTGFIRGEIKDERLRAAIVIRRDSGRTVYRISQADFKDYCLQWCPSALERFAS